jgi:lysophospholipase L1-like esterase
MSSKSTIHKISVHRLFQSLHHLFCASLVLTIVLFTSSFFAFGYSQPTGGISTTAQKWVGTWSTAPQLVEPGNNPPSPGLSNNTLRQIVRVSLGGDSLRMRFSNEFSTSPATMNSVHIAVSMGGGTIDSSTDKVLNFNGKPEITIEPGTAVTSDPFQFAVQPRTNAAITIYFGSTSPDVTGHPGSRTTSYLLAGNEVSKVDFSNAVQTDHWYIINGIDVLAPDSAAAVAVIGNSITDGRGSGTNKQNRWPDELARRLQENTETKQVAVLNQGIGGNCVLRACLGPSAVSRFKRDVLDQYGVKWLIILEGINDIGQAIGTQGSAKVAQDLIAAYEQMIDSAHAKGILVYGVTLLPFGGSSYYTVDHENARQTVNDWIRNSGRFDSVIDLDKALRDPANPLQLLPGADTGDHLHPNETGHRMMAESVDLTLFLGELSTYISEKSENLPNTFSLLQNYPNPSNPSTTITFTLPVKSFVTLNVFDSLGREVSKLVSEEMLPGTYSRQWNSEGLSSGAYFYRLVANAIPLGQAGSYIETKKLIIAK